MESLARETKLLQQIQSLGDSRILTAGRDAKSILSATLTQAREFFACEAGYLFLRRGDELGLALAQNDKATPRALGHLKTKPVPLSGGSVLAYAASNNEVLAADDAYQITGEVAFEPTLDRALGYKTRALLVIPIPGRDGSVQGVLQLCDGSAQAFPAGSSELARAMAAQAGLGLEYARELKRLDAMHWLTICQVGGAGEYEDADVKWHVRRISGYCHVLGRAAGMTQEEAEQLRFASPLHDIGKIAIPNEILYKPGKLTDAEFDQTKQHTVLGWNMLKDSDSPTLRMASEIAHHHHERFDGSGYPDGKIGDAIPLSARITAIADVFDALSTPRVYKPALPIDQSLKILCQEAGRHFDPQLVEVLQGVFSQILEIKRVHSSETPL